MAETKSIIPTEEAVVGLDILQHAKDEAEAGEVINLQGPKRLLWKLDLCLMPMM
jgi:hypothetical protein